MASTGLLFFRAVLCCTFLVQIKSANYLFYVPESGSHGRNTLCVVRGLAARGHNITLVVNDAISFNESTDYDVVTYKDEIMLNVIHEVMSRISKSALEGDSKGLSVVSASNGKLISAIAESYNNLLSNSTLVEQLRSKTFDLVFFETVHFEFVYIAKAIDVPYVIVDTMITPPNVPWAMRASANPSYIPSLTSEFDQYMDFLQRIQNTLIYISNFLQHYIFLWMIEPSAKLCHDLKVQKSSWELLGEAEILFVRTHFVLDFSRSLPPNVVPIGGLMARPPEPLEQDLESFVSRSGDHGTIIFSFGTYFKPLEFTRAEIFTEAFRRLKQHILMKHDGPMLPTLPNNTLALPWLPQNDILGHPRVKLFISHCGSNGVFEALYHAVPIICIPLYNDQFDVAQRVVSKGIGIKLDITLLTSSKLEKAILELLANQSFQANMDRLSAIYRDDPQTPIDRVIYWMEFLARHGGAQHLRSSAHDLNFLQLHLLDVIATLTAITVTTLLVAIKLFMCICRVSGKYAKICLGYKGRQNTFVKGKSD